MSPTMAEEIDALYSKFVLGVEPKAPSAFAANAFLPSPAEIAAFAARFGLAAADITGDNAEQAKITASDQFLPLPWPRIPPLKTPYVMAEVEEYAGMCFRPDGTHAPASKILVWKWRHSVELLAAPTTDTSDKANFILTGAGNAEPRAVCLAILTGLVDYPILGNVTYPGFATEDDVLTALTALPPPAVPYDPSKPGPSGR